MIDKLIEINPIGFTWVAVEKIGETPKNDSDRILVKKEAAGSCGISGCYFQVAIPSKEACYRSGTNDPEELYQWIKDFYTAYTDGKLPMVKPFKRRDVWNEEEIREDVRNVTPFPLQSIGSSTVSGTVHGYSYFKEKKVKIY